MTARLFVSIVAGRTNIYTTLKNTAVLAGKLKFDGSDVDFRIKGVALGGPVGTSWYIDVGRLCNSGYLYKPNLENYITISLEWWWSAIVGHVSEINVNHLRLIVG